MKLSNLKRALSLIVTVALIAGLVVMPAYAAGNSTETTALSATYGNAAREEVVEVSSGVYEVRSKVESGQPRAVIYPTTLNQETDAAFVAVQFSISTNRTEDWVIGNRGITRPTSEKRDYMVIADMTGHTATTYVKDNGYWVAASSAFTFTGTAFYVEIKIADSTFTVDETIATISDIKETLYKGEWSIGAIFGVVKKNATVGNSGSGASSVSGPVSGVWTLSSTASTSNPRLTFSTQESYNIGASTNADPKFVTIDYTLENLRNTDIGFADSYVYYVLPASATVDYKIVVNLETGKFSLYKKEAGAWTCEKTHTLTDGTFSYVYHKLQIGGGDSSPILYVSNLVEKAYYGTWSEGKLVYGDKVVKYPTPTVRRAGGSEVITNVGEGAWTVTVDTSNGHSLALPLTGLKAYDANDYKANFDVTAAYIKTEVTIDADTPYLFGGVEISALKEGGIALYKEADYDNGSTLSAVYNMPGEYNDVCKLTVIFDVANGKFYLYGLNAEPQQFSVVGGGKYNLKVWEGDAALDSNEMTGYMLDWTKGSGCGGTFSLTNYKQTTYYDGTLSVADVYAEGIADVETMDASLRDVYNKNNKVDANVDVVKAAGSETWTVTTTGEEGSDSTVKMFSGYFAPTTGYVATELTRNYADFVHFSATLEVTEGAYEGYVLETLGDRNYYGYIANTVYGNNGLPAFVLGEEYDIDMIYDVKTGNTYVYVNDVLCKIRDLSSSASFTGVGLTFTGVTSPVTAVVTNPSFKYYNKSASANIATVTAGLDNNGFKLNYKDLANGKAKAQFYGNLADECYVIAVYEGDVLKSASKVDFGGVAREIEANVGAGQTAKLFVWDAETLAPVLAPTSF